MEKVIIRHETFAALRDLYARIAACADVVEHLKLVGTRNEHEARILAGAIKDAHDRNKRKEATNDR